MCHAEDDIVLMNLLFKVFLLVVEFWPLMGNFSQVIRNKTSVAASKPTESMYK